MKNWLILSICLSVQFGVGETRGAGEVIRIGASGNLYTLAGGRTDIAGFADRVFFEDDTDGYPVETHVTGFGSAYHWVTPGVRMDGLLNNSGLYIEALVRSDSSASTPRDRALWYWNPVSGQVEDVPEDNHFALYKTWVSQSSSIFLSNSTTEPEPRFRVAAPAGGDMGLDTYGTFLRFALHRIVEPPVGVYGVFARFSSDFYLPSDPILLLFNHGQLTGAQMLSGAQTINGAAADLGLDGDFNHDGKVDAADYSVWRNGLGTIYTPADYTEWKTNFGHASGVGSAANVPEPAAAALPIAALIILPWLTRSRQRSTSA